MTLDGHWFLALRPDYFNDKEAKAPEPVKEVPKPKAKPKPPKPKVPETDPREAEIIKLREQLAALEAATELAKGDQAQITENSGE